MEQEVFFLIGLEPGAILWKVISGDTESYEEAQRWYYGEMRKAKSLYITVKIAKTIYG